MSEFDGSRLRLFLKCCFKSRLLFALFRSIYLLVICSAAFSFTLGVMCPQGRFTMAILRTRACSVMAHRRHGQLMFAGVPRPQSSNLPHQTGVASNQPGSQGPIGGRESGGHCGKTSGNNPASPILNAPNVIRMAWIHYLEAPRK